jgi:hypothetical protein
VPVVVVSRGVVKALHIQGRGGANPAVLIGGHGAVAQGVQGVEEVPHLCRRRLVIGAVAQHLIANAPDDHGGVVAVPPHQQGHLVWLPIPVVLIPAHHAQLIHGVQQGGRGGVVRRAPPIYAHFLELCHAVPLQVVREGHAHARVVLVVGRAHDFHVDAIEPKARVRVPLRAAHAKGGVARVNGAAPNAERGGQGVQRGLEGGVHEVPQRGAGDAQHARAGERPRGDGIGRSGARARARGHLRARGIQHGQGNGKVRGGGHVAPNLHGGREEAKPHGLPAAPRNGARDIAGGVNALGAQVHTLALHGEPHVAVNAPATGGGELRVEGVGGGVCKVCVRVSVCACARPRVNK